MNDEEDDSDISILVNRILSDIYIFDFNKIKYYQKSATSLLRTEADIIYKKTHEDNLYNDAFISEDQIKEILLSNEIIPTDYDSKYKKLNKQLESSKINLFKRYANKSYREQLRDDIGDQKKEIAKLFMKRHCLDFLLLDNFCNKIRVEYILCNTIYYYDSKQLVFDYDNLDMNYFNQIMQEIYSDELKSVEVFKKLARSSYWKNIWSCDKSKVFGTPVSEWSDEQKALINISRMYDSIHEHPDCPDDDLIKDDDALDGWMLFQKRKTLKEKKEKGVEEMLGKNKSNSQVLLMADNIDDAQEIIDMNTLGDIASFKSQIQTDISKSKFIKEIEKINNS